MFSCAWCYIVAFIILYKLLDYLVRIPRRRNLAQCFVLITGCDSGFGYEAAKRFDELGCHVIAGCLTELGESELRKKCSKRLVTLHLDVSKHDSVVEAYETVVDLLPKEKGLSGIVNNAGIFGEFGGLVEWLTLQDYTNTMRVNLLGMIDVTTTFLPLVKRERGRIVNTSSGSGRNAGIFNAPYTISKYGVEAFSDIIRRELRPFGISVHIVEPGAFKTNLTRPEHLLSMVEKSWKRLSEVKRQEYGEDFYNEIIKQYKSTNMEFIQQIMISSQLSSVVNAYEHALFGIFPRARYTVGKDLKYLFLPLQWLPEWLGDLMWIKLMPEPAACRQN